ncbi:hypothetical protein PHABIO_190 [Pseudomonas phage Phabio]|uniref:Uncharacterized protein n=1 Tax=Pseudomonas phage Phabio TaxID=2006668 RepID=A0A1Y0STL0_9CAUD|nr:polymerase [Pseudomonas phage Phabio]ARV76821.1 hypothetical protein PHABIO_190 [Pseudomonas phage Phabio]
MADSYLMGKIRERTEPFNMSLANGIAHEQLMAVSDAGKSAREAAVDQMFAINSAMFPEGFKYHGCHISRPEKHFEEITREYSSKRIANIAKNTNTMFTLKTSFKGEPCFDRHILIPYLLQGSTSFINGACYNYSPVLADVGYSVLSNSIFIPFARAKLTFKQNDHHYKCNGERKIMHVIWSQVHNEMSKRNKRDLDNRQQIESCLAHYFFCEFGVTDTFKQWANADIKIGKKSEFPESEYPRDQWNIYESAYLVGTHPTGEIVLAMLKEQETDFAKRLVAGFFYVVDTFPGRFVEPSYMDNKRVWRVLLGLMVFGDFEHIGKITENIDNHMESFNNYLDEMTIKNLSRVDVKVRTIWELLYCIMTQLSHHLYDTDIDETSMYHKQFSVMRYVMDDLNRAVTMFAFGFQSRKDKEWTKKDIDDALKRQFKLNTCMRKMNVEHGEVDIVSYPGDNKAIKLTSMVVPQDRARSSKSRNKSIIGDSSRLIHVSLSEVCQYKNQPKNNPDGRGRVSLWCDIDYDGMVKRNQEDKPFLDEVQKKFKR